ncbi:MAG: DUF502 domain-containing protein [candidate division NC10 bacterium]|nr:DUF502 domain-containing protein [candidate division NC10 bacterium]
MKTFRTTIRVKFLAGFFVLLPIVITLYFAWEFFSFVDGFFSPIYEGIMGFPVPGLGFLTAMLIIFLVGLIATNVAGKRVLQWGEILFLRIPIFKHIYSAIKQLLNAFSPDNQVAFKEFVIVEHPRKGEYAFGFLTGEVFLERNGVREALFAVYVPTNHLYLGDIVLFKREEVIRPRLSIQEGIQIILSGGTAVPKVLAIYSPSLAGAEAIRGS